MLNNLNSDRENPENVSNIKYVYCKLPYVQHCERELKHEVHKLNKKLPSNIRLRVAFSTQKTENMFPNKDKVPKELASNLIYLFSCERCTARYIGETKRHFCTRVDEHIRGRPSPSEISQHVHVATPENFEILLRTPYTKIAESIFIKNDSSGFLLNDKGSSIPLRLF